MILKIEREKEKKTPQKKPKELKGKRWRNILDWLSQSPDLNPNECPELDVAVGKPRRASLTAQHFPHTLTTMMHTFLSDLLKLDPRF